jgi:transposase/biotin operon repressor
MANKSISMSVIRRILQLKAQGISKNRISQMIDIHRTTLNSYILKLKSTGKTVEQLLGYSDEELSAIAYNVNNVNKPDGRLKILEDHFTYLKKELNRPGVTRLLLWEEYKEAYPDGYKYAQFCLHLARYLDQKKATMHFDHLPGDYFQFDFAGKSLHYVDFKTGEIVVCTVLVCVLPYSGYIYVEALQSAKSEFLFSALNRCLEYYGGVTRNALSDNMKQLVNKNERYEFTFQELAMQWAVHYNINLDATRPGKPKDKPSVESSVYISYLRIYARLRNEVFHSLNELNKRIRQLVEELNNKSFQRVPISRYMRFIEEEKPHLRPLPADPFTIKHITHGKVQSNYHVLLGENKRYYSAPYKYIGQKTKIIYDEQTVEIYIGFRRIATHKRSFRAGYTTIAEHMPEKHLKYKEMQGWNAEYFISIASKIGFNSEEVFRKILSSKEFIEQSYKACIGLKKLSETYGNDRFEAACKRALYGSRVNYGIIKNILKNNLDKLHLPQQQIFEIPEHENIRGPQTYNFN